METRRKIADISIILKWENLRHRNIARSIFLKPSNELWLNLDCVKIAQLFRVFAIITSPIVPIRDINRGWIQAAKTFSHFGRVNRVNAIVVYDFFCLSNAYRDSEKESEQLNADSPVASSAEER